MLLAAPLAAIIGGVGTRINIGTKSLYSFASGFMTDTLWAFVFAAAAVAVVTAVFYALRRIFVKKEYLTKCQKTTRERYDYRPRVFGFMPDFSDF